MLTPSERLFKRSDVFYYRRRIPSSLRDFFMQKIFVVSLKTIHFIDAKRLSACYDGYFDHLLTQQIMHNIRIDPKNIRQLIIQTDNAGNRKVEIRPEDTNALVSAGLSPDQIHSLFLASISGSSVPSVPVIEIKEDYPLLSDAIDLYHEDYRTLKHKPDYQPDTKHKTFLRRLIEIVGDIPINKMEYKHAILVLSRLQELPAQPAKYRHLKCTVDQLILLAINDDKLDPKTINDHLILYKNICDFFTRKFKISPNAFANITCPTDKKKPNSARSSFTREDLSVIFSTSLYTAGEYAHDYQFWVPLIALYTGARRAEIASLYDADIQKNSKDIWVFNINEDTDDKRVKTVNAIRKTPIHPHLLELGFLDFVKSKKGLLFNNLTHCDKEGYGRRIGEWFNTEYLKDLGLYVIKQKVFHSFRHTFATQLSVLDVHINVIEQLSGREFGEEKRVGEITYIDSIESTKLLAELSKLDFREQLKNVAWIPKA